MAADRHINHMNIEAWFDGACGPRNPGGTAAWGAFVLINKQDAWQGSAVVGRGAGMTCNVAEHAACYAVLEWLQYNGLDAAPAVTITIRGDSQLVIRHMTGQWRIKKGAYVETALKSRALLAKFKNRPKFLWIPRERNERADELSKAHLTGPVTDWSRVKKSSSKPAPLEEWDSRYRQHADELKSLLRQQEGEAQSDRHRSLWVRPAKHRTQRRRK
jgi:ribonuclease HI